MRVSKHFSNQLESEQYAAALSVLNKSGIFQELSSENDLFRMNDKEVASVMKNAPAEEVISFRAPNLSTNPSRVTENLMTALKGTSQVVIETFFHHPAECTKEVLLATAMLADAGHILNNRMFLVKGLNDNAETVKKLNHLLLMMRVRPYCLFIDEKYQVTADEAVQIIEALRGWTSGLAVPHLLKKNQQGQYETLLPDYIHEKKENGYVFRNYRKDTFVYRES